MEQGMTDRQGNRAAYIDEARKSGLIVKKNQGRKAKENNRENHRYL